MASRKYQKSVMAFERTANRNIETLEDVAKRIEKENLALSATHNDIQEEIEQLKMTKIDIANQITKNQQIVSGLTEILD